MKYQPASQHGHTLLRTWHSGVSTEHKTKSQLHARGLSFLFYTHTFITNMDRIINH